MYFMIFHAGLDASIQPGLFLGYACRDIVHVQIMCNVSILIIYVWVTQDVNTRTFCVCGILMHIKILHLLYSYFHVAIYVRLRVYSIYIYRCCACFVQRNMMLI